MAMTLPDWAILQQVVQDTLRQELPKLCEDIQQGVYKEVQRCFEQWAGAPNGGAEDPAGQLTRRSQAPTADLAEARRSVVKQANEELARSSPTTRQEFDPQRKSIAWAEQVSSRQDDDDMGFELDEIIRPMKRGNPDEPKVAPSRLSALRKTQETAVSDVEAISAGTSSPNFECDTDSGNAEPMGNPGVHPLWGVMIGDTDPLAGNAIRESRRESLTSDVMLRRSCSGVTRQSKAKGNQRNSNALLRPSKSNILSWRSFLWERVATIVASQRFEQLAAFFIVLNALVVGAQTEYSIRFIEEDPPRVFDYLEKVFTAVFCIEIGLRLVAYGLEFVTMEREWLWNLMDVVLVGGQLVEDIVVACASVGQGAPAAFTFFRIARIPRLIRIASVLRLLRFFQELRTMVDSIFNTLKSLASTIVLLILLIYTVSVYLTSLVAQEAHGRPWIIEGDKSLGEYYSSVFRSMLSVFQAATSGVDWNDILKPLMEDISPFLAIPIALYIAFTVLAMMNVITGVFVESALSAARGSKDAELRNTMQSLFQRTDADASGMISWDEFSGQLEDKDMARCFKLLDIDPSEAKGLFTLLDTDCSGEIDAEEFVMGCLRLQGTAKAIDLATLMYFNKRISNWWQVQISSIRGSLSDINSKLGELDEDIHNRGRTGSMRSSATISELADAQPPPAAARKMRGSVTYSSERSAVPKRDSTGSEQSLASFATWAGLKAERRNTLLGLKRGATANVLSSRHEEVEADSMCEDFEDGGAPVAKSKSDKTSLPFSRSANRAATQPTSGLRAVLPHTPDTG